MAVEYIKNQYAHMIKSFEIEIHNNSKEIDPCNEHHWLALTYGWAMGKGLPIEDALDFALYIRYYTDLG